MSANLSDNSCSVYAVVDKTRKVREDDQECSAMDSTPFAVYAVVDKTRQVREDDQQCSAMDSTPFSEYSVLDMSNSTGDKNTEDKERYGIETSCKEFDGVNDENVSSVYSVIDPKNTPGAVRIRIEKKKGGKKFKQPRQILFILVSVILLLLLIIAFSVALAKAYSGISNLNEKIIHTERNVSVGSSQQSSYSKHFIETLQNQLDEVKNNITAHSLQLLSDVIVLKSEFSFVRNLSDNTQKSLEMLNSTANTLSANLTDVIATNMKLDGIIYAFIRKNYSNLERSLNEIEVKLQNVTKKQRLNSIINAMPLASSCKEIYMQHGSLPSGYYWLKLSNGTNFKLYCNMTMSCDNITGGWMRVARLNKPDGGVAQCYPGLKHSDSNSSWCVRSTFGHGCTSIIFPVLNVQYSHVCGTIIGYGENTPDGFHRVGGTGNDINDVYVDGISLTYEDSGTQHIWTYVSRHTNVAACEFEMPRFVEGNLRCMNLIGGGSCSSNKCSPTFSRILVVPSSGDIEMRVCRDQDRKDEDIVLDEVEIFVR